MHCKTRLCAASEGFSEDVVVGSSDISVSVPVTRAGWSFEADGELILEPKSSFATHSEATLCDDDRQSERTKQEICSSEADLKRGEVLAEIDNQNGRFCGAITRGIGRLAE
jgi:hypothetical protein